MKQCKSCPHLQHSDGGYCYMFKQEPKHCLINTSKAPSRLPLSALLTVINHKD